MIWSISWRNVWRNKTRSLVIIAAVTIGLFGGILYYAFMLGMMQQRVDAAIANEISHVQLHHPKFLLNEETEFLIENPKEIADKIKLIKGVKAVTTRIKCNAMVSTAETGTGVMINGINPESEKQVTSLFNTLTEGKYPDAKDRIPIFIGKTLATKLNSRIGSKVVITVANMEGIITYGAFRIVGIFHTENDLFDEFNVFVRNNDLASLIGFDPTQANEIAISLTNNDQTLAVLEKINIILSDEISSEKLIAESWMEIEPTLNALIEAMDYFAYIFLFIILLALAFGIVNTMLMVVMERVREIGMLMAIGMNKKRIFRMIMLETVFLSVIGGVIGVIISIFTVNYFHVHGMDLSMVSEGFNSMGYSSMIYFYAEPSFYVETTILVIITALIASIYPARKALKLNPATAVRENE